MCGGGKKKENMKKVFLLFCLSFLSLCFAEENIISDFTEEHNTAITEEKKYKKMPKMDIDFRFYLPSLVGNTTGSNSYLKLRNYENYKNVNKSISFMVEGKGEIATINKFSFAFAFGGFSYVETLTNDEHMYGSIGLTLGSGVYYRTFFEKNALSGLYLFLYPIFNLPVYVFDYSTNSFAYEANDYYWKIATDLGYSLAILDILTISPYMRSIIGLTDGDINVALDFGFTVGIYFHDRNY